MRTALALVLGLSLTAQPVRADICDSLVGKIRGAAPNKLIVSNNIADEEAVEIHGENVVPFTGAEREGMAADIRTIGARADMDMDMSAIWTEALTGTPREIRIYGQSSVWELKSRQVGYLRIDHSGTAHCVSYLFYYRDAAGKLALVREADGKGFADETCYHSDAQLVRFGDDAAWVMSIPGAAIPQDYFRVSGWEAPTFVHTCDIVVEYDFRYNLQTTPDAGNPYEAFMAGGFADWLPDYRAYYDDRGADGRHPIARQTEIIQAFAVAHPEMAPQLQQLRADIRPGIDRFDVPVVYDGQPAVVRIEQAWLSTTQRWVYLEFWGFRNGTATELGRIEVEPHTTALRSLEIKRP